MVVDIILYVERSIPLYSGTVNVQNKSNNNYYYNLKRSLKDKSDNYRFRESDAIWNVLHRIMLQLVCIPIHTLTHAHADDHFDFKTEGVKETSS